MATDIDETLIQENIEEYVNDDNKVVTIKWLSLTLNIQINQAKKALTKFVKDHKGKQSDGDIHCTYFVAGLGKSDNGEPMHKCFVVPDTHLLEVEKSLSAVTSCHIYSIQKSILKNYIPLYMTDYDVIRENLEQCQSYSSIKSPLVKQRPKVEYMKSFETTSSNTKVSMSEAKCVKPSVATTSKVTNNKKPEPKGSIATMFASTDKKNEIKEKPATVKNENETSTGNKMMKPVVKQAGVLAMFNKQTNNNTKKIVTKTEPETESVSTVPTKKTDTVGAKGTNKRQLDSDKEEPKRKQRRRIKTDFFDSSEDEISGSEAEDEPDEPIDVVETHESEIEIINDSTESLKDSLNSVNSDKEMSVDKNNDDRTIKNEVKTTVVSGGKKRKRTKKVVTKNVLDDEGFMVTQKVTEWISETDDSDLENGKTEEEKKPEAVPAKISVTVKAEPKAKKAAKKNISPQKGKQTSLMSFFKKS
uniref:DNA polymerase delta subunit 3 n=1 Tax=Biomphalaria glabrata TaxID=6526 RepID=A0A2C9M7R7_BIOGL